MTQPENQNDAQTTEVSVETPAKVNTTTQVVSTDDLAGGPSPDSVSQATEAEPKQG